MIYLLKRFKSHFHNVVVRSGTHDRGDHDRVNNSCQWTTSSATSHMHNVRRRKQS